MKHSTQLAVTILFLGSRVVAALLLALLLVALVLIAFDSAFGFGVVGICLAAWHLGRLYRDARLPDACLPVRPSGPILRAQRNARHDGTPFTIQKLAAFAFVAGVAFGVGLTVADALQIPASDLFDSVWHEIWTGNFFHSPVPPSAMEPSRVDYGALIDAERLKKPGR